MAQRLDITCQPGITEFRARNRTRQPPTPCPSLPPPHSRSRVRVESASRPREIVHPEPDQHTDLWFIKQREVPRPRSTFFRTDIVNFHFETEKSANAIIASQVYEIEPEGGVQQRLMTIINEIFCRPFPCVG